MNGELLHVGGFHFIRSLPNFAQTNGAVEAIENGQRHWNVRDDGPCPQAVEIQLNRMTFGAWLFQRADGPHGQIGHQQKRDNLTAWFFAHMLGGGGIASTGIQDEHGLACGLYDRCKRRYKYEYCVFAHGEMAADNGECAIEEQARLCAHQQNVVQLEASQCVVLQVTHLHHTDQCGNGRRTVQRQFANGHLGNGERNKFRSWYQHKEQNQRDDCQYQYENANEESFVCSGTVDRVVVRWPFARRYSFGDTRRRLLVWPANATPHDIQNGRAYEWVFNGAREEKWRCILDQCADDVRTTALENVMRTLEAACHSSMSGGCLVDGMCGKSISYKVHDPWMIVVRLKPLWLKCISGATLTYPNDAKSGAYDFRDHRMLEFRVLSLVSIRSAIRTNWCRSCASNRSGRWFYGGTPSFAAKPPESTTLERK